MLVLTKNKMEILYKTTFTTLFKPVKRLRYIVAVLINYYLTVLISSV